MRWLTVFVCGFVAHSSMCAETIVVQDGSQLQQAASRATPGTTILLKSGRYPGGISLNDLKGKEGSPITIAGEDAENPPLIEGGNSGIHLRDPSHVVLRDLVLKGSRGNGLNIDDGGTFETPATDVTIERLTIQDIGERANQDAIKLSGVDRFVVKECTLLRWGGGGSGIDMVGCHNGEIVLCKFENPGADGGNGVQAKGGSSNVAVRRCLFQAAGGRGINIGGSTGRQFFRPKIQGYEAKDITVEDCTFVGCGAPIAYVGVDRAVVRYNTIYKPQLWVLRILQETRSSDFVPSRNGRFEHNLVVFDSTLRSIVNIGDKTAPETFTFTENAWYCLDRPDVTKRMVQLPTPEQNGRYDAKPQFTDPQAGDFSLAESSPLSEYGVRSE